MESTIFKEIKRSKYSVAKSSSVAISIIEQIFLALSSARKTIFFAVNRLYRRGRNSFASSECTTKDSQALHTPSL